MLMLCVLFLIGLAVVVAGRFGFRIQWWRQANPTPAVFLLSALALFAIAIQIGTETEWTEGDSDFTAGLTACGFALGGGLSLISAAIVTSRTNGPSD